MIRINLLNEEVDKKGFYIAQSLIYFTVLGLAFVACTFLSGGAKRQLADMQIEKDSLNRDLTKLKRETAKVQGLEDKKKILTQKLMTISTLKTKKYGPVRVLDELNLSVPERAWLKSVSEEGDNVGIDGVALDDQTVSAFMVKLEESDYFSNVDLVQSREHQQDGVMLREFTLTSKLVNTLELKSKKESAEVGEVDPALEK